MQTGNTRRLTAAMVLCAVVAAISASASGAMVTTATGSGADAFLRRNNTQIVNTNAALAVKFQNDGTAEANGNDRIGVLKFDTSGLGTPINAAILRLETFTAAANQFVAGQMVQLYGIPETLPSV